jgi:SAM-dependent methyltransferase
MLKSLFDRVMERRSRQLVANVQEWLPRDGSILDIGSGTGHLSAYLEQQLGLDVVTADVSDMHVVGRQPVLITDGVLPFPDRAHSATLLFFMLAYPRDPVQVLREAVRVTHGPVILVQSLYSGKFGYAWHRAREFAWTIVAFHVSKAIGYVPPQARFSMHTRRFYTNAALHRDLASAGLRVTARQDRPVAPGGILMVSSMKLEYHA